MGLEWKFIPKPNADIFLPLKCNLGLATLMWVVFSCPERGLYLIKASILFYSRSAPWSILHVSVWHLIVSIFST